MKTRNRPYTRRHIKPAPPKKVVREAVVPPPAEAAPAPPPSSSALWGKLHALDVFGDSYENHQPSPTKPAKVANKFLDVVAPIRTQERVINGWEGTAFGVSFGVTLSHLDLVRKNPTGVEFIQVVNLDGSSNLETVVGRLPLSMNHRIEVQGPAFNTSLTPGELPVSARVIGFGLTSDVTSAMDHGALSYTVEVKLTTTGIAELATLGGPGAAVLAADALAGVAGNAAAAVVSDAVLGAVPILSATLAAASWRRAVHVWKDPTAASGMTVFAISHALADTVRIFAPLTGTAMNAGLVGIAALCGWVHVRYAQHEAPAGPSDDGTPPATT